VVSNTVSVILTTPQMGDTANESEPHQTRISRAIDRALFGPVIEFIVTGLLILVFTAALVGSLIASFRPPHTESPPMDSRCGDICADDSGYDDGPHWP
jgi:hypothetical protein